MNREQRQEVERRLCYPGASVKLACDGYEVVLEVLRDKMKLVIVVFVDGSWKGEWLLHDCEQRRRFMRPVTRRFGKPYTPAQIRLLGKKWCDERRKPRTYYLPYWASVKPLLNHLEKHNTSVELASKSTAVATKEA